MPKKLTIVEINSVPFGSTGGIMTSIANEARQAGHRVYVCYPNGRHNPIGRLQDSIMIGGRFSEDLHILLYRLTGLNGCFSVVSTALFIRKLKKLRPDIIHLHNLHNCYLNLPMLFRFIRGNNIKTVWTLHDCWAFTGHCPHYEYAACAKWKDGCYHCPLYKEYPECLVDSSRLMWKLKRKWFSGVPHLTIITPSEWLANQVRSSFLSNNPISVIHSGIDLNLFRQKTSRFKEQHGIADKLMVLGVAMEWTEKKGVDAFEKLAGLLGNKYRIVLVSAVEGCEMTLSDDIICLHTRKKPEDLAEIYSAADVFVNPTREEVLGLVNLEALACGTPVVTFRSGGSPECIDETCGIIVDKDDLQGMENAIKKVCEEKGISKEACIKRATSFDKKNNYKQYVELFQEICSM